MSLQQIFSETSAPRVQIRFNVTPSGRTMLYEPLAWRPTEGKWVTLASEAIEQAELDATVTAAGWQMDLLPTPIIYPELMYSFKKAS